MIFRRYRWVLLLVFIAFAFESGCAANKSRHQQWMSHDAGPGPLAPLPENMKDFFAEHEVTIQWGERSRTFRAVLQYRNHTLDLIVLGPMEQPVVRIYQKGEEVGVERLVQVALPFEPEYILADVQKAFFRWDDVNDSDDHAGRGTYQSLTWTETRNGARVQRREFQREDLPQDLPLRVEYTYEQDDAMPSHVQLENTWFGYTLTIRTLRWSFLP